MEVVHTTRYMPLTVEVAVECVSVISYFQTLFTSFIDANHSLDFDYLLALCNNSFRAYECVGLFRLFAVSGFWMLPRACFRYSVEFFENKIGNLLDDRGGASADTVADGTERKPPSAFP